MISPEKSLLDFPLQPSEGADFSIPLAASAPDPPLADVSTARLTRRAAALVADAAMILLIWAAAVLVAASLRHAEPTPDVLLWSAAFWLLLWFCATVPALVLFGKTVGMAVVGLSALPAAGRRRLTAREATLRALGTLATGASLGIPLLWTSRRAQAPTPADRLSARPLVDDELAK